MNNEVTLANAQWCREQAAKYTKLANAIEEILNGSTIASSVSEGSKQGALFQGNKALPSFDQIQKAALKYKRVKLISKFFDMIPEDYIRDMLTTSNSQFYIGGAGWIRRKGEDDPFKKQSV